MKSRDNTFFTKGEFTLRALFLGIIIALMMTAANTYLGLYAGMTVSASIPAAVISMAIMRGLLKTGSLLENNIVQTMASAGESLAAGIIFTVPALVIIGVWKDFQFWPTTIIALCGGLLGIIFMIPLRRALIVEDENLTYPEGVACAEVLKAGDNQSSGSMGFIFKGLALGALVKLFVTGFHILKGTVEGAVVSFGRVFYFGSDISPAMAGVGYLIKLRISLLVFFGSASAWLIAVPLLNVPDSLSQKPALDQAWFLWKNYIRYAGVGAMVVGGLWSIISVRKGIKQGLQSMASAASGNKKIINKEDEKADKDLSIMTMGAVFFSTLIMMLFLYEFLTGKWGLSIITAIVMAIASFFFVAVSSYIVGLVGSTNNPVSGMTISALIATSALFLILGWKGDSAILATLGVAGVVCCAASSAGDVSQDLKTGHLLGATPAAQQKAQIIGIAVSAGIIAPVLTLLHSAYGIGTGLKAPQATLFASIAKALFGKGNLPWTMIIIGAGAAVLIIIADLVMKKRGSTQGIPVMPVAVGIYLPITLIVPMLCGGIIRHFTDKRETVELESEDRGTLIATGLIAGEALMGVFLAIFIILKVNMKVGISSMVSIPLSLCVLGIILFYLYKKK